MSEESNNKSRGYLGGLVTGVLIGAGIALLLAPKRGDEMRDELLSNAAQWKDQAAGSTLADRAQQVKERASQLGQDLGQKAKDLKAKGQETAEDVVENAQDQAEDAAQAVSDKVDEIKE